MLQKAVLLGVLGIFAYQDGKEKKVKLYVLILAAVSGLLFHFGGGKQSLTDMLLGMAIGGCVLLISFASRGNIGAGDGLIIFVCGIFLGFEENLELFFTSLFLLGVAALFLLVVMRKERTCQIPFGPFLLTGYVLLLLGS